MKRAYVLLLALILILTGCTGGSKSSNISVEDVCCPYEITSQKDGLRITLQDGDKRGIHWQIEAIPEAICNLTQENADKEYVCRYIVSGKEEGAAQLTFTALQEDETVIFVLTLVVDVDSAGKVSVSTHQHREREDTSVDVDGLNYKWNVDVDGILNFSFFNSEDSWSVRGDGEGICTLSNMMSTPTGCKFSAQAISAGQTGVLLVGETTQREIRVIIQADENGKLEVLSVQEQ